MDIDSFDDFGIDLYPGQEAGFSDSDPDVDKMNCISSEKADKTVQK